MTSVEEIETHIKPFLLTTVTFTLDGKKLKTGKLMLFTVRDFFCIFTLIDTIKNKKVLYEVPYPFNVHPFEQKLEFDYTVDSFCEKCLDIKNIITTLYPPKTSKLFNKKLVLTSCL